MKIECIKYNCSECCKRYWITLLPEEVKRIAEELRLREKEFIEKKCVLIAHIYKREQGSDGLTINSQLLPKKVALFAKGAFGFLPSYFLILPSIALKRNAKGECILLCGGKCLVHNVAPVICKLFPFVAIGKKPLKEIYPFCVALQQRGFEKAIGSIDEKQRKRVNSYFDKVERKGFAACWKYLPKSGVILLEGEKGLKISKKEFLQLIKPIL